MEPNVPKPDTKGGWKSAELHPDAGYNRPKEYGASPDRGMPLYGFSQGPRSPGGLVRNRELLFHEESFAPRPAAE